MTLEDKLKEIEGYDSRSVRADQVKGLIAALRKCREQRRENALGWEQFDYEFEANWSEEKDDAELLSILSGPPEEGK